LSETGRLLDRYYRLVEALSGAEEQTWGRRGIFSVHGVLAGLYAYSIGLLEGLDAEALLVATLVNEAAKAIERGVGDVCPRRRRGLVLEALRGAGFPEELVKRVEELLSSDRGARAVVDAGSLAKLSLPGFLALVAARVERGRDVVAGLLEAASRELTAISHMDCLLGLESSRRLGAGLAKSLTRLIDEALEELHGLGIGTRIDKRRTARGELVVVEPLACPFCGHSLEAEEHTNPGCGGLTRKYRCPRCGWHMSVTVCPPPPCR